MDAGNRALVSSGMILSIRGFGQYSEDYTLSVLLRHDHSFGFPEHNGWKLIEPLHDYFVARGLAYSVSGQWEPNGANDGHTQSFFIHVDIPGLTDDDLVYISMRWLSDLSLLEAVR